MLKDAKMEMTPELRTLWVANRTAGVRAIICKIVDGEHNTAQVRAQTPQYQFKRVLCVEQKAVLC